MARPRPKGRKAPKFTVQRVPVEDQQLQRLNRRIFGKGLGLERSLAYWWLVFRGKRPMGFAGLQLLEADHDAAFLCRAGVLPTYRGYGLQRRLIRCRERLARALGRRRIVTYTARTNLVSANNLIRCGYRLYTPTWEWGLRGALYFYRVLWAKDASDAVAQRVGHSRLEIGA